MKVDIDAIKRKIAYESAMHHIGRDMRRFFIQLLIFAIVVLLLYAFVFSGVKVNGDSMAPGICDGDLAIYNKLDKNYDYGDTVIIRQGNADVDYYIKRVIGKPGDIVNITVDGYVEVNETILDEDYLVQTETDIRDKQFPYTVPVGEYFVLGDNRSISKDSRDIEFGKVRPDDIKGSLLLVVRQYW